VFIAYAIAILLVLGWVISIAKRLKDVEDRLGH
jgi:CcmD family protein